MTAASDLRTRFGAVYTAAITDVLDGPGRRHQTLPPENGGCRDIDLVRQSGLPVFARYRTPQDAVSRWEVLQWGHSIEIEGVADGVAGDLIEAVLEEAEALVGTENLIRDAVRGGLKPLAAYERFGKF